jgi:hypothetical protein
MGVLVQNFPTLAPILWEGINLRISLNLRTTPQVGVAAWYPKNGKYFWALRASLDNTAG